MEPIQRQHLEDQLVDLTFQQVMDLVRHADAVFHFADNLDGRLYGDTAPLTRLALRISEAFDRHPELEAACDDRNLSDLAFQRATTVLDHQYLNHRWEPPGDGSINMRISHLAGAVVSELAAVLQAAALRDVITGADYDLLTCVWRAVLGPVHPHHTHTLADPVTVWREHITGKAANA